MKLFRWSGLIAFAVVLTLILVIGLLFLDNWVKAGLEAGGTRVHGAEVNVASVDLTLSPLGFDVRGVQVTDKERPERNLFELDTARLAMDLPKLFLGKISIDDLTVSGLSSGTERSEPGRIVPVDASESGVADRAREAAATRAESVRAALPEPADAVDQALTQTRQATDQARTTFESARSEVGNALNNLPDDASIEQYDARIEALRGRSLNSLDAIRAARTDLDSLQRQAVQDQLAVAAARQAANSAVGDSRDALDTALAAPAKDWAALREAYPLNQASAVQAGRLLLGDAIFDRYDQARKYYTQAAPWLRRLAPAGGEQEDAGPARLDGRYVRFDTPNPTPNFLLRQGLISFVADDWPWSLTLSQITGQQRLTGEPSRLQLMRGEAGDEAMRIDAVLDRRESTTVDRFNLIGRDLAFSSRSLELGGVDVDWAPGSVDLGGEVTVTGDQVDGLIELNFSGSVFEARGEGQIATTLGNALEGIAAFDIGIRVTGNISAPELQLTSDLDNQIRSALSAALQAEYNRWLDATRARLDAEVDTLTAPIQARFDEIEAQGDAVREQADAFQQQVMDRLAALEQDLQNQRDRLSNAADAERRRAEEEARRRAEDALDDLQLPSF
ncbi:TIGR03545 family protein [Saccharospirillum impatiens]|uniref:TIGR03545 family protein n=1 Tax=Saccharospirillum impatiens TaxID=169438 RepID=UPI00040BDC86|nr:TIGR03545 family protein [Saccharospirillum impatiens]